MSSEPQRIQLSDYREPSYLAKTTHLEFELHEESIEGIGSVLKARLVKPPKPPAGISRFLKRWS